MRIDAKEALYRTQEAEWVERLPPVLRLPWLSARAKKFALVARRPLVGSRGRTPKGPTPIGLWAGASSCLVLKSLVSVFQAGAKLSPAVTEFSELLDPTVVQRLLDGPLKGKSGPTRALMLAAVATFATRVLNLDGSGVYRASRRVIKTEPRTDRSAMLKTYQEYQTAAFNLDPQMEEGESHGLDTAICSRRAATAVIAVEAAPRRTELTGLHFEDIVIDRARVFVRIPARLSKTGVSQVRTLTPHGGAIVIEYVSHARKFLTSLLPEDAPVPENLWLTDEGRAPNQMTIVVTLTRDLAKSLGVPVTCNLLRRAMASRKDIIEAEAGDYLANLNRTANNVYAQTDYTDALSDIVDIWNELDKEIEE